MCFAFEKAAAGLVAIFEHTHAHPHAHTHTLSPSIYFSYLHVRIRTLYTVPPSPLRTTQAQHQRLTYKRAIASSPFSPNLLYTYLMFHVF